MIPNDKNMADAPYSGFQEVSAFEEKPKSTGILAEPQEA